MELNFFNIFLIFLPSNVPAHEVGLDSHCHSCCLLSPCSLGNLKGLVHFNGSIFNGRFPLNKYITRTERLHKSGIMNKFCRDGGRDDKISYTFQRSTLSWLVTDTSAYIFLDHVRSPQGHHYTTLLQNCDSPLKKSAKID